MKISPLRDRVIVKRLQEECKTASDVVIPDTAARKPDQGEIMAVDPERLQSAAVEREGGRMAPGSIPITGLRPHELKTPLGLNACLFNFPHLEHSHEQPCQ